MFEIAGGIVLAYLIIRFRYTLLGAVVIVFSWVLSRLFGRQRDVFAKPKPGTTEHLQWANREGIWQYERTEPPKPSRDSEEYMDWVNREGKWADDR